MPWRFATGGAARRRSTRWLATMRTAFPPRPLTLDEKAEVLSIRELAWWTVRATVHAPDNAMDHTVLLVSLSPQEVPVGYRTVIVVPVPDLAQVPELLRPYRE